MISKRDLDSIRIHEKKLKLTWKWNEVFFSFFCLRKICNHLDVENYLHNGIIVLRTNFRDLDKTISLICDICVQFSHAFETRRISCARQSFPFKTKKVILYWFRCFLLQTAMLLRHFFRHSLICVLSCKKRHENGQKNAKRPVFTSRSRFSEKIVKLWLTICDFSFLRKHRKRTSSH